MVNAPPTDQGFPNAFTSLADEMFNHSNGGVPNSVDGPSDIFIAEFNGSNNLVWSTFLGGVGNEAFSFGGNGYISVNPNDPNEFSIMGSVDDFDNFPLRNDLNGFQQNNADDEDFVLTFRNRKLRWSTSFGCLDIGSVSGYINASSLTYDDNNNLFVTGVSNCLPSPPSEYCQIPSNGNNLIICPPQNTSQFFQDEAPFDGQLTNALYGGALESHISIFTPNRNIIYSGYLGGSGNDVINHCVFDHSNGNLNFVGYTESAEAPLLPVTFPAGAYMQPTMELNEEAGALNGEGFIGIFNFDLLTNISEQNLERIPLLIFPNPTLEEITILFPDSWEGTVQETGYSIYDVLGKKITSGQLLFEPNGRTQIQLTNLPAGTYLLKIGSFGYKIVKI